MKSHAVKSYVEFHINRIDRSLGLAQLLIYFCDLSIMTNLSRLDIGTDSMNLYSIIHLLPSVQNIFFYNLLLKDDSKKQVGTEHVFAPSSW
jgi:hypothetical protein